jgi:small subunit ribosomal protein S9
LRIKEPIEIAKDILGDFNFNISVNVKGGGQESQIEASRLAIAKALAEFTKSVKLRKAFLDYDRNLLVADTRRKESYKPGISKARAKRQKSYR